MERPRHALSVAGMVSATSAAIRPWEEILRNVPSVGGKGASSEEPAARFGLHEPVLATWEPGRQSNHLP